MNEQYLIYTILDPPARRCAEPAPNVGDSQEAGGKVIRLPAQAGARL